MSNEQGVQGRVQAGKKTMIKGMVASLAALAALGSASAAHAAYYIDYWGDDLFLGLAYHRFGCLSNENTISSNQDYDGFTTKRYCYSGQSSNAPGSAGYVALDWNTTSGAAQLNSCGTQANNTYGTANYAASSTTCSYNILMNCNSDCWIRKFSTCQGRKIGIASPCF